MTLQVKCNIIIFIPNIVSMRLIKKWWSLSVGVEYENHM